jgi:hypothetical protein
MSNSHAETAARTGTLGIGVHGGGGPKRIARILLVAIIIEAIAILYLTSLEPEVETDVPSRGNIE